MSNLLSDAIIDAKALRESALKNAESIVMEKYSSEVKEALEQLLEQEDEMGMPADPAAAMADPAADPAMEDPTADLGIEMPEMPVEDAAPSGDSDVVSSGDVSFASTDGFSEMDGKNLKGLPSPGAETEVTINLGALQEALEELNNDLDEEVILDDEALNNILSEDDDSDSDDHDDEDPSSGYAAETDDSAAKAEASAAQDEEAMKGMEETIDFDSLVDTIAEKLTVDMGAELSGWAGRPTSQLKHEQERELAGAQSDDVKEDLEDLNKAQEELVAENSQLKEKLDQYKQALNELKEGLQDVNLSNARLLYTNRVLRNTSLNERQKTKIAEAISNAGSVTEARTIFDTLQSTVESAPKRAPQSLGEAINRNRTSVIRATRSESTKSDPFQDRMKKLAGIK
jgi:hypothetical protein